MLKYFSIVLLILSASLSIAQNDESWKIFDDSEVGTIRISIEPERLNWIYDNVLSDSLHPAGFQIENAELSKTIDSVGFRIRGNTSRYSEKKSFKISFNTFNKGGDFYGLEKLNLNGEHNDPSIARSKICWDLYSMICMKSTRANHYEVYINDEYYGLYVNVEHIDETFIERNFINDSGDLWKCLSVADLTYRGANPNDYKYEAQGKRVYDLKTNTDLDDYSKLAFFIYVLNNHSSAQFEDFAMEHLDLSSFLKYFSMNILVGSWDDYWFLASNYYLYHNPGDNKFYMIPYDYDNTFGVDWFNIDWSRINPYEFGSPNGERPLIEQLLGVQKFKNLYTHFLEINSKNLLESVITSYYLYTFQSKLEPFAENDLYRTMDYGFSMYDFRMAFTLSPYKRSHVHNSIGEFVANRYASLKAQLEYTETEPVIYNMNYYPKNPSPNDSIYVEVAAFGYPQIENITIQYHPELLTVIYSYPMESKPVSNSKIPEEIDRYIGVIPPLGPNTSGSFYAIATNSSGVSKEYPIENWINIRTGSALTGEVLINELMARNDSTIADEDGEYDDWVEIYNPNNFEVNLSGKFLTDSQNNLTKWSFPDGALLPAGSTILVWCDDDSTEGNFHTNFKLDGDGEFLAIVESDSVTFVDSISFGEQIVDVSWGRDINDSNLWGFMEPTPGTLNTVVGVDNDIIQPDDFKLSAYPNPFNPSVRIIFNLPESQDIELVIFNMLGREVWKQQFPNAHAGFHEIKWNAENKDNRQLSSGIYIARLKGKSVQSSIKLMLLK